MRESIAALLRLSLEPFSSQGQLRQALELILEGPWLSPVRAACLYLVNRDTGRMSCKASYGAPQTAEEALADVSVGCCLCGRKIDSREIIFDRCSPLEVAHRSKGGPERYHYCVPLMSKDRGVGLLNITVEPSHRPSPALRDFLSSVADVLAGIFERHQAEESLRLSEERFDLAVKGTHAGIWDWNLLTKEAYFSPRWKEMLGYEDHELPGRFETWRKRLHPDDVDVALETIAAYLRGQLAEYELEHRLRHKDGSYRWIIARGAILRDPEGRPLRFVGTHIDVTDRKRTEEALRDREARLIAARKIQERLLPQTAPDIPGLDVAGASLPAEFTAGDSFDYLLFPDQTLGLVIADVSGHGFDSALLMATANARMRSYAESPIGLSEIVRRTNRALVGETDGDRFITMLIAQIDPREQSLRFVNAGHPPGYLLRSSGEIKAVLESPSLPLAVLPDAPYPVGGPISLEPGDVLLLLTDGVIDPYSDGVAAFGIESVLEVVRQDLSRPSAEILASLVEAIRSYRSALDFTDDVTAVVMRYMPSSAPERAPLSSTKANAP
jgi:PAS domain S-box-containing protein